MGRSRLIYDVLIELWPLGKMFYFLLNECMCRRGENCQSYPQDMGCSFFIVHRSLYNQRP